MSGSLPPVVTGPVELRATVRRRARGRARLLGLVLGGMLAAVGVRGAQLCVSPDEQTIAASTVQRWGRVTMRAPRGDILDRHGRRLATTVDAPSVIVDPALVSPEEVRTLAAEVAAILELDPREVAARMSRDSRYASLANNVHPALVDRIERLDHPALWVHRNPRRYYPEGVLASQVLGFVDASGVGREGLEASLDEYLRGGVTLVQRRRDRRGLAVDGPVEDPGRGRGMDVHTTLDRTIQRITERALGAVVERSAPQSAYAVVIDVATGDVLAMANAPTFDPNALQTDPFPRRNHVVQDAIEPGSVLKPFTLALAVEEGLVDESTPVDCEGGAYHIGRTRIRDDHPHKIVTATEVVKYSSNIGTAKLALQLGPEKLIGALNAFGFGARTGITLPGERRGALRAPGAIRPIELATTSYGQGMTVTPLQLGMAVAALGNGGTLMRPRLVTEVVDRDGVPSWQQRPDALRQVVKPETAAALARMMTSVTEEGGTGTRARVPGFAVAGKTGTAEKVQDGRYTSARIGSFVGFVPADDPVLAIVVVVDEPSKGSRYGGIVAGPAFAEIAAESLRYLGVEPTDEAHRADPRDALASLEPLDAPPLRLSWEDASWTVPDLKGRSMRDVLVALQGAGLGVRVEGSGRAIAQRPIPGAVIPVGETVTVVFR